jgi:lysophospholipase L1-like esterase
MTSILSRLTRLILLPILTVAILSGCASTPTHSAKLQSIKISQTHDAVKPVPRHAKWMERHNSFNVNAAKGGWELLMIGDSITHAWESHGKDVWAEYYADRKALNLGISGDRTQHILWRLDNGNVDGLDPKAAVIMIGTNNYRDNTAEEIAEGITAIVQKLNAKFPKMNILILGIFPRFAEPTHEKRIMLAKASALTSKLADGKRIHYLDIGDAFLTKDGVLTKKVMPDYLHPHTPGYKIWAEAMEPKIKEIMGE